MEIVGSFEIRLREGFGRNRSEAFPLCLSRTYLVFISAFPVVQRLLVVEVCDVQDAEVETGRQLKKLHI